MELSSEEGGEIPIPINSTTYGGGHGNGHGHIIHHHDPSPPPPPPRPQDPSNGSSMEDHQGPYKKVAIIRYRECLKNHAASMGGNATDGCGEFMPSGQEGTIEALTCSACHCHRNFHRKEVEGDDHDQPYKRRFHLGYPTPPPGTILPSRTVPPPPHHMILPYNLMGPLPSDQSDHEQEGGRMEARQPLQLVKKRFRTKFTQEQKEKMLGFAEQVGWKIQKQEESVVQQFCQELGIKRRVLKVWMHNNKHNLAKKNPPSTTIA